MSDTPVHCERCGMEYDEARRECPQCGAATPKRRVDRSDGDYVTCVWCGFVGRLDGGCHRCPDCGASPLKPMRDSQRAAYDAGTFTYLEDNFDTLCGYTGAYGDIRRAALRAKR